MRWRLFRLPWSDEIHFLCMEIHGERGRGLKYILASWLFFFLVNFCTELFPGFHIFIQESKNELYTWIHMLFIKRPDHYNSVHFNLLKYLKYQQISSDPETDRICRAVECGSMQFHILSLPIAAAFFTDLQLELVLKHSVWNFYQYTV